MINLLPPIYRQSLRSHRRSSLTRRWLIITWLSTIGLVLVMAVGWFYINQQSNNLRQAIAHTQADLKAQNLDKVQKDAATLSNNIKTINQVLSREIRFSSLIQDIGKIMPPGTVLDSLTLTQATGALDLSAKARDYASAAQIAVNLSDPKNQIFSKIDIVNVKCSNEAGAYPCAASFRTLFSKTAQSNYQGVAKDSRQ